MAYVFPTLYVIISYTLFLMLGYAIELTPIPLLLLFIMGLINLIVVLTAGRKWSRKTLLNCTMIIKYGLVPFYLIGGLITIIVTGCALFSFPLPLMPLLGIITILLLVLGYGVLFGAAPYAIAYLVRACKEGTHSKGTAILSGICQFFFIFDVVAMMSLTLKERHLVKTTICVCVAAGLCILLIVLLLVNLFIPM